MIYTNGVRVILAGAGPGDPGLLTLKAVQAIQEAEVILYDALVNQEVLDYAGGNCLLINVGKRKGNHRFTQDEINRTILFYAQRFTKVLRLKGGDPFVFGRGSEEREYLGKNGIQALVIPGISSAIAGPSSAGIPVTQRGVSESFWVITGTVASGKLSQDIELAARSSATVVILMGMTHLHEIVRLFRDSRTGDEPIAIVQAATLPHQQVFTGTVSTIREVIGGTGSDAPAVIIIGKVVTARYATQIMQEEQVKMKLAV